MGIMVAEPPSTRNKGGIKLTISSGATVAMEAKEHVQNKLGNSSRSRCVFDLPDSGWVPADTTNYGDHSKQARLFRNDVQQTMFRDRSELDFEKSLLKHIQKQWSVESSMLLDRSPSAFKFRHNCQDEEPVIAATFKNPKLRSALRLNRSEMMAQLQLAMVSVRSQQVRLVGANSGGWRENAVKAMVQALAAEVDLPDMDFWISVGDHSEGPPGVFKHAGKVGESLLMVPFSVLGLKFDQTVTKSAQASCPNGRHSNVVFRGGTDSPAPDRRHSVSQAKAMNMRYFAASLSNRRPDLLDAGLTFQKNNWTAILRKEKLWRPKLLYAEQMCYAAVLVIDGNANPFRFAEQLQWGIPVIFMHRSSSGHEQDEFWYEEIKPGHEYIRASPANLESVLEALLKDPRRFECIGRNGAEFVQQRLNVDRQKCYMYSLLTEYAERAVIV